MAMPEQERFAFVNKVGCEAFELITKRMEELGPLSFTELFPSVAGAATVCLANVLAPAVEASNNRAQAADKLLASMSRQARTFLESVVSQQR